MGGLQELDRLFAELSVAVRRTDDAGAAKTAGELLLERLNPNHASLASSTRVLDAVLSQMCFGACEVYESGVNYIVKTLVAVMSSSIYCDVLRGCDGGKKNVETLRIGSCIRLADQERMIRSCIDVLRNLNGHVLFRTLLRAVLKLAVSTSNFRILFPVSSLYYENHEIPRASESSCISDMQSLIPDETHENRNEIPLRSFFWYLDPTLLKDEISKLLEEIHQRPFICLKDEFHENMNWRTLLISLVTSPCAFMKTKALLHNWFLATGMASIGNLQAALVSSLLDILSRPMWWGLSLELGLKLPFLQAYFPGQCSELLSALTEPVSSEGLLDLVKLITRSVDLSSARIDSDSTWAMLMNFPAWFHFAAALLFRSDNDETLTLIHKSASRYLAMVLGYPIKEESFTRCSDLLNKLSKSWIMMMNSSNSKTKKRKTAGSRIEIWLKIFDQYHKEFCMSEREIKTMEIVDQKSSPLFLRIPLGILVSHCKILDERECDILLSYAATSPSSGIALVFSLFDYVEEVDEVEVNVSEMKRKSVTYLLRCLRKMFLDDGGERDATWKDILVRLVGWRDHGISEDILNEIRRI